MANAKRGRRLGEAASLDPNDLKVPVTEILELIRFLDRNCGLSRRKTANVHFDSKEETYVARCVYAGLPTARVDRRLGFQANGLSRQELRLLCGKDRDLPSPRSASVRLYYLLQDSVGFDNLMHGKSGRSKTMKKRDMEDFRKFNLLVVPCRTGC